jgi:diguanylate cyclase (GGDEF)-like protein
MEPAVLSRATEKPDASAARRDRRVRAVYRRELQSNVFLSAYVVACWIAASAIAACLLQPAVAPTFVALTAPLAAVAIVVASLVRRRGRRYVVPLGMLLALLPILLTAVSVVLVHDSEALVLGCIGLIPLSFAIFIPLERRPHILWLAMADVAFFGLALTMRGRSLDPSYPVALAFAAVMATGLSLAANELQLRRRRETSEQLLAIRGLYGRMKEHETDLRRQDDFLFMQQETLVSQQAELLHLNEELETIARLDALTGLGNRLRLNEDLAQLAGRIERSGGTAGLLLLDLDRFKRLNDAAGHLAGDAALRGVADVLRKTSRVGDGLYRYGGEEFLVVLHDADQAVLRTAGQRYLTALESAGMAHPDNPPYGVVTASAGATELSQANCADVDIPLRDADEALYVAKGNGRNRLEIHVPRGTADVVPINQERAAS